MEAAAYACAIQDPARPRDRVCRQQLRPALCGRPAGAEEAKTYAVAFPDSEWKRRLTPAQYRILRGHGTEFAGSSPLNAEKRKGTFVCAGCDQPLFRSETKFESGTG